MKKLALLIFLALPLMAQAPADPVKEFMAEHAQMELTIKQMTAKIAALEAQIKSQPKCEDKK